ncbi:hypothetical protein Pmar_PMAR026199 [Perkinsus marinus ATCC 50983]|uniref:Chitin-binding type-4 domain-containing protein n=1 Tax=Perkinsus marinus (strain ATCC 50983 / TXsc) TaxID=423536 RepID=C5LUU3_PERM5|nr:hypothetical protein Pmar_PMAR026199 [Perkinsus marinus ATCC 50983]EEQ99499.1 hypothetical protein Pmar_PMAR026199 [Perkinsus marinus ATCC 50983]|eukprot:XP_002766782.1 hypothetical protein Pmar_PMAR026199 [Perkinsus marinus ATCC 50983]
MATYTHGHNIDIEIHLTVHHWGHFEFRICEGGLNGDKYSTQKAGQDCLNKNLLVRPDPKTRSDCRNATNIDASNYDCQPLDEEHPERWYLPPPNFGTDGMKYRMTFKLPENLTCSVCLVNKTFLNPIPLVMDSGEDCLSQESTKERETAENTNPIIKYLDRRPAERGPFYLMSNVLPYHPQIAIPTTNIRNRTLYLRPNTIVIMSSIQRVHEQQRTMSMSSATSIVLHVLVRFDRIAAITADKMLKCEVLIMIKI